MGQKSEDRVLCKIIASRSLSRIPRKLQSHGTEICGGVLRRDTVPLDPSTSDELSGRERRLSLVDDELPNEETSSFLNMRDCSSR